jgi:hypothetical protein
MKTDHAKEKCSAGLLQIAKDVLPADRKKAMTIYNRSYITISRYLGGQVANLALGIELLNFFKNQLRKRDNKINKVVKK